MQNLENHFIIAMPTMKDPYFSKTVTYICEHNDEGAMGLVINQPVDIKLDSLLKQIKIDVSADNLTDTPVYAGGPVGTERGFVLHRSEAENEWASSINISKELSLTTSKDILQAIGADLGPQDYLITLGYAGWSAGQLEKELQENSWLTIEADSDIIFKQPIHKRWEAATEKLGFNPWQISSDVGHA
ncbi:YqgE/AlgH family protein [Saccharobesus litoralis]|uniref:UPF0301 protein C2869_12485 n=1 Tax=Saccharobesus litoralis TaxID=2172099 RepID=A0A2S0VSP7_9ALTE|nr:YqgE/AlgH family protein [Saccharobesus litoralis]AWB67202.1 YqgE/AlgH family protein [Saccharobesus litoralis]